MSKESEPFAISAAVIANLRFNGSRLPFSGALGRRRSAKRASTLHPPALLIANMAATHAKLHMITATSAPFIAIMASSVATLRQILATGRPLSATPSVLLATPWAPGA